MRITNILFLIIFIIVFSFITNYAHALTAYEIIEKSETALRGNTQVSVSEITVKTRRWTRTMKLKS
jgi:hypothetical protein